MTSGGDSSRIEDPEDAPIPIPGEVVSRYYSEGFVHSLVEISGELHHFWTVRKGNFIFPVSTLKGEELLDAAIEQASCISLGKPDSDRLFYQSFPRWDEKALMDLESNDVTIGTVPEGEGERIRMTSGGSRYEISYQRKLLADPSPSYMLSRLNANGYPYTVDLLGISYWKRDGRNIPWMMMIRYPEGTGSGFTPYLSDLNRLLGTTVRKHSDELRGFLLELTRSGSGESYALSRRIGRAIGELHGSLILDTVEKGKGDSEGARILKLFSRSNMGMEEIGSTLGRVSGYLDEIKKGLVKETGDGKPRSAQSRKQKVVRNRRDPEKGLSLLKLSFSKRQKRMRERFSSLRKFKGSPLIASGLDCSLDKVEMDGYTNPIFRKFDWTLHNPEGSRITKILPLKDLALVLNSLKKARYLSSLRIMERALRGRDASGLDLLFLEYNLAKKGYSYMMSDLNAFLHVKRRDIPFRLVFLTSITSSIWYEKNRNSLILGYNEGLSGTSKEDLLIYPRGADTLEGIKMMQILTSISSASKTLTEGIKSRVGLESDLLTALTV
jgi:hypothetical protein